ncbi:MAG: chemotaxis protein CheD [Firmicutes bacterium]|jgi:chemotaxis protein CheD|nr:chemotaxis protein CheD [Bacillota bacterium]MDD4336413.1 chemotaxis protein CheD [Bacillota bacterium]MDD4793060.1 chemotaxis protein CheD [Bacillota bacterium]
MTLDEARDVVPIGIGEMHVSDQPGDVLVAYGLGSCIGVVIHDPVRKVGGMAHVALPESLSARDSGTRRDLKYADVGVPMLIDEVLKLGAERARLVARIAGGARMFDVLPKLEFMDIGVRNAEAIRGILKTMRIPIVAEDIGGNGGRTLRYFVGREKVLVRRLGMAEEEL